MTLPPDLTQACRQRQLLILWTARPFLLAAGPPPNRAMALNRVLACLAGLPAPPRALTRLPPLPVLSLDSTNRLEQLFQAAELPLPVVRGRHDLPARNRHSLLKLAGDLVTRTGVTLSRAEIHDLRRDPDKAYLLAEARRLAQNGVLLLLGDAPTGRDFETWWAVLHPALGRPPAYALGKRTAEWPEGIAGLDTDLDTLATALQAVAPEPEPPKPAVKAPPQAENKYIINLYGPVQGLTIGDSAQVEQQFRTIQGDWETLIGQMMARLDSLSAQLAREATDLKQGQAALYRQIDQAYRADLARILAALQQGRLAQGEMQATLTSLRRAMRVILNRGVPMDPELRAAIEDLTEAVESSLSLDQKLELALPLVPLLLHYKIELAAGSELDLHDLRAELQTRWQQLVQSCVKPSA